MFPMLKKNGKTGKNYRLIMESTHPHVIFNGKGQVEGEALCPFIALRSESTKGRRVTVILAAQPFQCFHTTKQVLPGGEYTDVDSCRALVASVGQPNPQVRAK